MEKYFIVTFKDGRKRIMWGTEEQAREFCEQCGATFEEKEY